MSYTAALRIKSFRDLWLGQAISQIGDAFYYVIFLYMVERLTGNIKMVGVVGALEALPYLVFGPHAGILADRLDRRHIMLLSDLFSGGTLLLFASWLAFDAKPPTVMLLVVPFLLSTVRVFFMPAKSAAVPALVPAHLLQTANAFSSMTQSLMPMVGLSLSASVLGLLYTAFPRWFFFVAVAVNGLSFFGSAIYIARLPKIVPDRKDIAEVHPMTDFRDGLRYMRSRRDLSVLLVLLTLFRLTVAPFFVVLLAANKQWFGGNPQPVAWFECSFFFGLVAASFFVGKMRLVKAGQCFSLGLAIVGATVFGLGLTPYFWMFVFWNVVAGIAVAFADIPINTYMQLSVPDAFRGRVNAVIQMIATGAMPIGMALGGQLVDSVGVVGTFMLMGIGMTIAALVGLLDRSYRDIRMPDVETPPSDLGEGEPALISGEDQEVGEPVRTAEASEAKSSHSAMCL